jgi:zinc-ribbon domain
LTVVRTIEVGEVLSKSARILSTRPLIMVPQLIVLVPTLLGDALGASSILSPLRIIASLLTIVLTVMASGAYPSLVKTFLAGGELSPMDALGMAYRRFWPLLAAAVVVAIVVVLGAIALLVPGIIFATWYVYTIPAMMLEDKGALEGMSASKDFGHKKKWSTFLLFLAVALTYLVASVFDDVFSLASPLLGEFVYDILLVPIAAWASVIFSYTYLSYGPSQGPATPEPVVFGALPPAQPGAPVGAPGRFCSSCGSPLSPRAIVCPSCGKIA